jgi:phosphoribosylanthranilate isomerase
MPPRGARNLLISPPFKIAIVMRAQVKICGITRPEDAVLCRDSGVDAIGLVFYPPSPRYVADLGLARELAQAAGAMTNVVALFVDAETSAVDRVLTKVPVNTLQFHGAETAEQCEQYERPYWKALRMKQGIDVVSEAARYMSARAILLDAYVKGKPGGTGERFNWNDVPELPLPLILAGGLDPGNVALAVKQVQPQAVDVSGGVESTPGQKSPELVKQFLRNLVGE